MCTDVVCTCMCITAINSFCAFFVDDIISHLYIPVKWHEPIKGGEEVSVVGRSLLEWLL